MEGKFVKNLEVIKNQAKCEIFGDELNDLKKSEIFKQIIEKKIDIDIVTQNSHSMDCKNFRIILNINMKDVLLLESILKNLKIKYKIRKNLTKICIFGIGIKTNKDVIYDVISKLYKEKIEILTISTSEVKIMLLIENKKKTNFKFLLDM